MHGEGHRFIFHFRNVVLPSQLKGHLSVFFLFTFAPSVVEISQHTY